MFEEITDFNIDIDNILEAINNNCANAKDLKEKLIELKNSLVNAPDLIVPSNYSTEEDLDFEKSESFETIVLPYIKLYRKIDIASIDTITSILPSESDYHYNEILLRLCAESLKEIKECEELKIEENLEQDIDLETIIETEKQKMNYIKRLLEPNEELSENSEIKNKIILAPNINDNISVLKDIERIPSSYYEEVTILLDSIINNTFKRFKRFINVYKVNGFCEVRGKKIRIIFRRLNNDTYGLVTIFMKKTTSDYGYREFIKTKINNFIAIYDLLKDNLDNPEFLELNDFYLSELYNKLGIVTSKERKM